MAQKPIFAQSQEGIRITFPQEILNANSQVNYYLYRSNDKSKDKFGKATLNQERSFLIPNSFLHVGNYILKVNWTKDNKEYQVDYDVIWK